MLIEDFIVETSVSYSEAGELSRVAVWISATLNSCRNQAVLEQLLVEEASVAAKISNQIAYLCSDSCIFMLDQTLQISVDVRVVDRVVELFRDPCEL